MGWLVSQTIVTVAMLPKVMSQSRAWSTNYIERCVGEMRRLTELCMKELQDQPPQAAQAYGEVTTHLTGKRQRKAEKLRVVDQEMQVAILAGGLATRLGNLTRGQPKSMVRVQGESFLEYQVEFLRKAGVSEVVLCIGHLGEQIESYLGDGKRFGMSIKYSHEPRLLGTAGALRKAEGLLQDVFFTLYGDSYLFLDFSSVMSYFKSRNRLALMTVYKNYDRYDWSNTAVEGNMVTRFSKKERSPDMVYIEYGANIFCKKVLQMIPEGEPYSLEELFPRLIEMGELLAFEVKERFYEIGSPQGLEDFTQFVKRSTL